MRGPEFVQKNENDADAQVQEGMEGSVLLWPAVAVIKLLAFQVKVVVYMATIGLWAFNFSWSVVAHPVTTITQARDLASEIASGAFDQGLGLISDVGGGMLKTGSALNKFTKRAIYGCLTISYIIFILCLLLIPAFLFDSIILYQLVEDPIEIHEILHFDYSHSRPVAMVSLLSVKEIENARKIVSTNPDKIVGSHVIPVSHKYRVTVTLTLPESEYNQRLGMFQVSGYLLSVKGDVLATANRLCMLRFVSTPVRLAKSLLFGLPVLMGFFAETQKLVVPIFESQIEERVPTAGVQIFIEPKAGCLEGSCLPDIYEATLQLQSSLPWLKALVRSWRWIFYLWNGVGIFVMELAIVLCCCRKIFVPTLGAHSGPDEPVPIAELQNERAETGMQLKCLVESDDDVSDSLDLPDSLDSPYPRDLRKAALSNMEDLGTRDPRETVLLSKMEIVESESSMEDLDESSRRETFPTSNLEAAESESSMESSMEHIEEPVPREAFPPSCIEVSESSAVDDR